MKVICLTGGPAALKTSTLKLAKRQFGDKVLFVPETATMLLRNGFPVPGVDLAWSQEWQDKFEGAVLPLQYNMEDTFKLMAVEKGVQLIVCDRGIIDCAGYIEGGLHTLKHRYGVDVDAALKRYDKVIHLQSLAVKDPILYSQVDKDSFENPEQACDREQRILDAWARHPDREFILCRSNPTEKMEEALVEIAYVLEKQQ